MHCTQSKPLSDFELELLLDQEAPPDVVAHAHRCPACADRLAARAAAEAPLRRLFQAECPSTLALGEWRLGLLPAEEARRVAAHTALCPGCQHEMVLMDEMLALPLRSPRPAFDGLRQLVATLVQHRPQASQTPVLALRGSTKEQLSFSTEGLTLTLMTEPQFGGRLMLIGLVMEAQDSDLGALIGQPVHLLQYDQMVAETQVDDLNNFTFEHVPPGPYSLTLARGHDLIMIPELELALV